MESEKIIWGLVSAFIGGFSGIFAAYWRTRYTAKAQDFSKRIEELCASINKLEELACNFWNESDEDGRKNISKPYVLGVKTKITLLMNYLEQQYSGFYTVAITSMVIDFFKACTGDSFESLDSKRDPERQREILITGEKLKIELMRTRSSRY